MQFCSSTYLSINDVLITLSSIDVPSLKKRQNDKILGKRSDFMSV